MLAQQSGHLALIGRHLGKEGPESLLALRLLQQSHHQRAGGNPEGGARGAVHVLKRLLIHREKIIELEQAAVFEKRLVKPAVALIEPPRGGLAQAVREPRRHEHRLSGSAIRPAFSARS